MVGAGSWCGRNALIKQEAYDVYIGRVVPRSGLKASVWGNPFKLGKDGTREEIMAKFRAWLPT